MVRFNWRRLRIAAAALTCCAAANVYAGPEWVEPIDVDAGSTPGTAISVNDQGDEVGRIKGRLTPSSNPALGPTDDQDMFVIYIDQPVTFYASTSPVLGGSAEFDTQLWLFKIDGLGLLGNDNTFPDIEGEGLLQYSTIWNSSNDGTKVVITEPGLYLLAISTDATKPISENGDIFNLQFPGEVSGPDGPGGGLPITDWNFIPPPIPFGPSATVEYVIALEGVIPVPSENAAQVLAPSGEALKISGNGQTTFDGDVQVNSNSNKAMQVSGNGYTGAESFNVVGGIKITGNAVVSGELHPGADAGTDMFASLPEPNHKSAPVRSTVKLNLRGGNHKLQPGQYIGGISISGSAVVSFSPGVYFIKGGGITMSGNATATLNEALIYNSNNAKPAIEMGNILVNGNANVTATPVDQGDYEGLSIFQDRNPALPRRTITIGGNGVVSLGAVYASRADVSLGGNAQSTITTGRMVCWTLKVAGNGTCEINNE